MISALTDKYVSSCISEVLSPKSFFSRADSLEVEIGCGKGLFLAEEGLKYPERFYLGIEYAAAYANLAEERVNRKRLSNVRIVNWSAEDLLPYFAASTVRRFHIYFPDPWPKRRHLKRRLWSEEFVAQLARILEPSGKVYFATDFLEYFETVLELLALPTGPFVLERREDFRFFEDASQPTSYEKKFAVEGRPLRFASFVKKGGRHNDKT